MQTYGKFWGFLLGSALFGLVMPPVDGCRFFLVFPKKQLQVAQFLLDHGSSQGLRDKLGNTAGAALTCFSGKKSCWTFAQKFVGHNDAGIF